MDPNETLQAIRHIIAQGDLSQPETAERLAELVGALDTWLAHGGFLPHGWTERR